MTDMKSTCKGRNTVWKDNLISRQSRSTEDESM